MMKNISGKLLLSKLFTLLGIILFVSSFSMIFGSENSLTGVVVITAILMYKHVDVNLYFKDAIIALIIAFIIMPLGSYLSTINPWIGLIVNFIIMFLLTFTFTTGEATKNKAYVPFILGYVFLQGNPISIQQLPSRFMAVSIGAILIIFFYFKYHRKDTSNSEFTLKNIYSNIDFTSLHFNFALRMALGVSLAMLIGDLLGLTKAMWISVSAMSITQPCYYQSKTRMKERIISTIIGAILFIILFEIIVPDKFIALLTLTLSYIYSFVEKYHIKIVFVTISSLGAAIILYDTAVSVPLRIVCVILGTIVAIIVNRIFRPKQIV